MAILTGKDGSIYSRSTVTAMSGEACTSVGSGVYQITDADHRIIDWPTATTPLTIGGGTLNKSYMDDGVDHFTGKFKITEGTGQTPSVTGAWMTITQTGYIFSWTLAGETPNADITAIGDAWGNTVKSGGNKPTVTLSRYRNDAELQGSALASTWVMLKLYEDATAGYWVKGLQTSYGLTKSVGAVDQEALTFAADGPISAI